jgi:hypothetical protein
MTPIIIATTTLTPNPATTWTQAAWYREAAILPIAPSVTRPTTRRPARISDTMVCNILAHKRKKGRLKRSRSFSILCSATRPNTQRDNLVCFYWQHNL